MRADTLCWWTAKTVIALLWARGDWLRTACPSFPSAINDLGVPLGFRGFELHAGAHQRAAENLDGNNQRKYRFK